MSSFRTYRGPKGQGEAHKEPHHRENDVACKNLVDDLPKVPFSISPGLKLACSRSWYGGGEGERASVRERRRTLTESVFFERSMPASKNASPGHMPSTRVVDTLREGVAHHRVRIVTCVCARVRSGVTNLEELAVQFLHRIRICRTTAAPRSEGVASCSN